MSKLLVKSVKGMHDCIPNDILIYRNIESIFKILMKIYCFQEIRLPIIEKTSLFNRSLGLYNNIVSKEMYSFVDRNGLNLSLRPEGTAGCLRAYIQNNLFSNKILNKLWYLGPMFRYENTQKGRFRQFYQIGVEVFGYKNISIDIELILIIKKLWEKLGVVNLLNLEINCIGSIKDRNKYLVNIKKVIYNKKNGVLNNLDFNKINFFRLLDSKNKKIKDFCNNLPRIIDFVNCDSLYSFKKLCKNLTILGINYKINYKLVRGLDYYNDFVFEWTINYGGKKSICSGGRYDNLSKHLSKFSIPAVGFAIGLDRLVDLLKDSNKNIFINKNNIDVYIISSFNNKSKILGIKIMEKIFDYFYDSVSIYNDYSEYKNLGKKISKIIKLKPRIIIIIDKNEIINNFITIKNVFLNVQKKVFFKDIINTVINFLK